MQARRRRRPSQRSTNSDAAIDRLHVAKAALRDADTAIDDAIGLLTGTGPEPPEPEPDPDAIPVAPGDDLLAMIDAAPDGAIFAIDPAYVGNLGDASIKKPVSLRSASPPPDGQRVGLDLVAPTITGSITFKAAGIECLGIRFQGKGTTAIIAADGTVLDRCVITGPADGGPQQRGVYANAEDIAITCCHIGGIYKDVDTQAVLCTRFTKRLSIVDCLLEASGENFMSGGDDGEFADETPEDILIERCTLSKPVSWQGKAGCTNKNLFELKNARRVVLRDCILDHSWADGQTGYAIVLSVRNQYGRAPWSTIEDVLIEGNTISHVGAGVSILGRDYSHESQIMRRVTIRNNTIADLSTAWKEGSQSAAGVAFFISGGPDALTLEDNDTAIEPGKAKAAIQFDQIQHLTTGLVVRRCRMFEGDYGMTGQAPGVIGVDQINGHAPGYVWENVTIVKGTSGRSIKYPAGTTIED